jgi:hypothetical protein
VHDSARIMRGRTTECRRLKQSLGLRRFVGVVLYASNLRLSPATQYARLLTLSGVTVAVVQDPTLRPSAADVLQQLQAVHARGALGDAGALPQHALDSARGERSLDRAAAKSWIQRSLDRVSSLSTSFARRFSL